MSTKQFCEDSAVNLYREGWQAYHSGQPLSEMMAVSSKSGWRDAKKCDIS